MPFAGTVKNCSKPSMSYRDSTKSVAACTFVTRMGNGLSFTSVMLMALDGKTSGLLPTGGGAVTA